MAAGIDVARPADPTEAALAEALGRLATAAADLARLALGDLPGPPAAAARRVLGVVEGQVHAAKSMLLAAVEADGRWAAGGADRTLPGWAARREGVSFGAARRELALGRTLGQLATARAAVVSGEITASHADVLAQVALSSPARQAALGSDLPDRNEAFLVERARRLPADDFRRLVNRWAVAVDGQAAEREHTAAVVKESLVLGRRPDGLAITGFLTHENGELLATAIRAVAGVPAKDDDRSLEQRQAAALSGAMRLVLDKGLAGKGAQIRPHLNVHVTLETLERVTADASASDRPSVAVTGLEPDLVAPAELDSGHPVPASVLARIACDSEVTRIVFGPDGQVLDVGRAERTYTRQLRRAIIARDRHCQYPGCSAAPNLGEVHHIRWWDHGGPTSIANGVLLCWYHHDLVHRHGLRIERVHRGFAFTRPDGRPVGGANAGVSPPDPLRSSASPPQPPRSSWSSLPPQPPTSRPSPRPGRVPSRPPVGPSATSRAPERQSWTRRAPAQRRRAATTADARAAEPSGQAMFDVEPSSG